jgi:hypothetical protein
VSRRLNDEARKFCNACRKVFLWFDSLAIKGWKNNLKESDLWGLAHENKLVLFHSLDD